MIADGLGAGAAPGGGAGAAGACVAATGKSGWVPRGASGCAAIAGGGSEGKWVDWADVLAGGIELGAIGCAGDMEAGDSGDGFPSPAEASPGGGASSDPHSGQWTSHASWSSTSSNDSPHRAQIIRPSYRRVRIPTTISNDSNDRPTERPRNPAVLRGTRRRPPRVVPVGRYDRSFGRWSSAKNGTERGSIPAFRRTSAVPRRWLGWIPRPV